MVRYFYFFFYKTQSFDDIVFISCRFYKQNTLSAYIMSSVCVLWYIHDAHNKKKMERWKKTIYLFVLNC